MYTLLSAASPVDAVRVESTQGAAGTTVSVPITIYDVSTLGVTGVDLKLTYDPAILTPTSDANGTTAFTFGDVVTGSWSMEQNVFTPGELEVSMAGAFDSPLTGAGVLAYVAFDVDTAAVTNTTSALGLTRADLNEGAASSTPVDGLFTVVEFMYGDVTGNGALSGYDASHKLEHVAQELIGGHHTYPIETQTPVWAAAPLTHDEAHAVADVDGDGVCTAMDASLILQKAVGLIPSFPVEGVGAPSATPVAGAYSLQAMASSQRPGARIVVSLDAVGVGDLYAGELRLDYDETLVRFVDVDVAPSDGQRPMLVHRLGDGQASIAFAAARPIDTSRSALEVAFETLGGMARAEAGSIRASHLRLNRTLLNSGFDYAFRVEPYRDQLLANYPNPFNPETWIPFELAADSDVTIRIYGMDGGVVRTLDLGARAMGEHTSRENAAYWDGANEHGEAVASGVYVYELTAGDYHSLRRMVVRK